MWTGEFTPELEELYRQYIALHDVPPDSYDELMCDEMTYDEFVGYIKECLATGKEMPRVVPLFEGMTYDESIEYLKYLEECLATGKEIPDDVP